MEEKQSFVGERIQPPKILIQDSATHADPFALYIMEKIYTRAELLIERDDVDKYYAENFEADLSVEWYASVNNGHCEDIVAYVLDELANSEFDSSRISPKGRVYKRGGHPAHYWIQYETEDGDYFHFDAEAPWGVADWKSLPAIRATLPRIMLLTEQKDVDPRDDPNNKVLGITGMENGETG